MKSWKIVLIIIISIAAICGIILIALVALTMFAVNPSSNFPEARDTQRQSDVTAILNAVKQYLADESNSLDDFGDIPICENRKAKIGTSEINLQEFLVPEYLVAIPSDPLNGTNEDTGYIICETKKAQVKIGAPNAEGDKTIEDKR